MRYKNIVPGVYANDYISFEKIMSATYVLNFQYDRV